MKNMALIALTDERECDLEGIIFETRWKAEKVIRDMKNIINQYGIVSVADLRDLLGFLGSNSDNKWGWTNIEDAELIKVEDGYLLKLPKTKLIK